MPEVKLSAITSKDITDAILRNREGKIKVKPGYDGVYGEPVFDGAADHDYYTDEPTQSANQSEDQTSPSISAARNSDDNKSSSEVKVEEVQMPLKKKQTGLNDFF